MFYNTKPSFTLKKMSTPATTTLSRETVHRLVKDVAQLIKNPLTDHGIYYEHNEQDMLRGKAMIMGSSETPYFGGFYFFDFEFPMDYPFSPPKVSIKTRGENIRFHPNLYPCGKVCLSLLNTWRGEQWTSCQTISSLLLSLCCLLTAEPFLHEPGISSSHADFMAYQEIITFKNLELACCGVLSSLSSSSQDNLFSQIIHQQFQLQGENWKSKIIKEREKNPVPHWVNMSFYRMKIWIDYNVLLNKFNELCQSLLKKN